MVYKSVYLMLGTCVYDGSKGGKEGEKDGGM